MRTATNLMYALMSMGFTWLAISLFTGSLPIESGNYLPEEVTIAEGKIVHFESYFKGLKPRKSWYRKTRRSAQLSAGSTLGIVHAHHSTPTPLDGEGITVVIAYNDEEGNEKRLQETWMLPCYGQFQQGSSVPVMWHKAKPTPKSAIMSRTMPKVILSHGQAETTPGDEPELRRRRIAELTEIQQQFAPLFKQIDEYKKAYFDPKIKKWKFENAEAEWRERLGANL